MTDKVAVVVASATGGNVFYHNLYDKTLVASQHQKCKMVAQIDVAAHVARETWGQCVLSQFLWPNPNLYNTQDFDDARYISNANHHKHLRSDFAPIMIFSIWN